MRRIALGLLLAASLAGSAIAQVGIEWGGPNNQSSLALIAPTAPPGDSSDRIANTSFVANAVSSGTMTLANGKIFIGSAGNLAVAQTLSGDCTLIASGVITCTQAAGAFTVVGTLSVGGGVLQTNIAAPSTPAAGKTQVYVDATQKVLSAKNDAGTISITTVPLTCAANQWLNSVSVAGVHACAQPAFSNLSGNIAISQINSGTGASSSTFLRGDNTWVAVSGTGDVVGPAAATDNAAVRFDATTGKLVQNSALIIDDTTGRISRSGNGGISVQGTNTNASAAAGDVGEYGEATLNNASAISLTNNTPVDIITFSLAAGDYDVWGVVLFTSGGSTVVTQIAAWISTTTNTFPSNDSGVISAIGFGAGKTGGQADFLTTPVVRILLSGTTTVRLEARALFTTSTASASGTIKWRRRW